VAVCTIGGGTGGAGTGGGGTGGAVLAGGAVAPSSGAPPAGAGTSLCAHAGAASNKGTTMDRQIAGVLMKDLVSWKHLGPALGTRGNTASVPRDRARLS
jgi:hypothetical protein